MATVAGWIDLESFQKDVLQSNKILVAGKTLEEWLGVNKQARVNVVRPAATQNAELLSKPTRLMRRSQLNLS